MNEPDRIEELLRAAMRARVEGTMAAPGLARKALRGAARGRRLQHAATAAASVAAVGGVTAAGVAIEHSRVAAPALGTAPSPSSSCYATASAEPATPSVSATTAVGTAPASQALASKASATMAADQSLASKALASASASLAAMSPGTFTDNRPMSQAPSQQIQEVSLTDPAPRYPVRRGADAVVPTGFGPSANYWTATFTVAQTLPAAHTAAGGVVQTEPTEHGATVLVIDGHPFDLSNPTRIEGVPVSGTTTVLGHKAWITSACDQTDVVFSTGRFQVLLAGFPGGDRTVADANLASLQTLAAALHGLQ